MSEETLPKNVIKFCPKCGSEKFYTAGKRSFLCANCEFHFYINSSAAVAAIITNKQGEVLFTHRAIEPNKGMLDLPGGFVDPMETAEEAVIREIKEELGLRVTALEYLCSYPNEYVFSDYSVFTVDLAFIVNVEDMSTIRAMDDISSYEFYLPDQVNFEELTSVSMKKIIQAFIQYERSH